MQQQQWTQAQRMFRSGALVALVALVVAIALPGGVIRAADDTMNATNAAQAQLPSGYQVTYTQIVDLGGNGQMQAIIKAESTPSEAATLTAQIVGLLVQEGGNWLFRVKTTPFMDAGTTAEIYAYPKNSQHPGFVIINQHICGANCNGGTYNLFLYDGSNNFPKVITGVNDRGTLSADPDTAAVTLTGPVYAYADARCCPQYRYTRTYTWQKNTLTQSDLTFAPAPGKMVPAWLTSDGPTLVTLLDGFVAQPALGNAITVSYIAPVFADTVTVKDAANDACTASGDAIAQVLAKGIAPGGGAIWPTADGYNLALHWDSRTMPEGIAADSCILDAGANGGYVLHLTRVGNRFVGDMLFATPQIRDATPADAIQLPPV